MSWTKTTVDGKVMWESPGGERVRDRSDIPGMEYKGYQPQSPDIEPFCPPMVPLDIDLSTEWSFLRGLLWGTVLGVGCTAAFFLKLGPF